MEHKRFYQRLKQLFAENGLLRRLASAITFGVGGAAGSRALMLVASIIVSRILDADTYGQFSLLNTTVTTFVTLSGGGIGATLTRYIALEKSDAAKVSEYIGTLRLICFIMSSIICVFLFCFVKPISIWLSGDAQLCQYLRMTTIAVLLSAMSSIEQSILVGFENFKQSALIQIIRCFTYLISSTGFSLALGIEGAILALVLSHLVQYILFLVANRKEYNRRSIFPIVHFTQEMKTAIVHFTIPAFVSSFFISPTTWFTNFLLAKYSGYVDTAVFSIAYQWMTLLIFIPSQMSNIRPIYTELYANHDYRELKKLFLRTTTGSLLLITPVAMTVAFLSKFILNLYGETYVQGYIVLCLMAVASIVFTLQSQVGPLIHAIGRMWVGFAANLLLGINMISIFYLFIDYGSIGLAISYCISYSIHCLFYFIVCNQIMRKEKRAIGNINDKRVTR